MSIRCRFPLLLGLFLLPAAAGAEERRFTPEAAVRQALASNPELKAARLRIGLAQARLRWAGKLENPTVEFSGSSDRIGLDDEESVLDIALSQKFPLTKRLEREREVSAADLALAEAEVRVREWKLAGEVREAVIESLAWRLKIALQRELLAVREELAGNLERAFEAAEASSLDVTEAKLEAQAQIRTLREMEAEETAVNGRLRPLLGLSPDNRVSITGTMPTPEPAGPVSLSDEAVARRPDLQLQMLQGERAEAALALARSQRWEDVAIRLFLEREAARDEPDGLERNTFLGLGLSLPLPLRTPEARLTDAPSQELAISRAETEALALAIRNEITASRQVLQDRYEVWARAGRETLALTRRHVREVRQAFNAGQESFVRLQRSEERGLSLEESAIDSLRDYHLAKVRLEQARGPGK